MKKIKKKLGRRKEHRNSLIVNLSLSLINHRKIRTTLAKAKALRPFFEKLITKAKEDTLHRRKLLNLKLFNNNTAVTKLLKIGQEQFQRPGGYTRIVKLIDGAIIELVS